MVVVVALVLAVTDPFGSNSPSGAGVTDNEYPTSTTTVAEEGISSQTSVERDARLRRELHRSRSRAARAPRRLRRPSRPYSPTRPRSPRTRLRSPRHKSDREPTNASTLLAAQATVNLDESR